MHLFTTLPAGAQTTLWLPALFPALTSKINDERL